MRGWVAPRNWVESRKIEDFEITKDTESKSRKAVARARGRDG